MKAMADNTGTGTLPAICTVMLGIISKLFAEIPLGTLAQWMTLIVGIYTLYINFPKFKNRLAGTVAWIKSFFKRKS